MKVYGVRHKETHRVLGWECSPNTGDFCVDICFAFEWAGDWAPVWLVSTRAKAEKALAFSPCWYNASYDSPMHDYVVREDSPPLSETCEVYEVDLAVEDG